MWKIYSLASLIEERSLEEVALSVELGRDQGTVVVVEREQAAVERL